MVSIPFCTRVLRGEEATHELVSEPSAVSTAAMLVWTSASASDAEAAEPSELTALSALETASRTVWMTVVRAALLLQN